MTTLIWDQTGEVLNARKSETFHCIAKQNEMWAPGAQVAHIGLPDRVTVLSSSTLGIIQCTWFLTVLAV